MTCVKVEWMLPKLLSMNVCAQSTSSFFRASVCEHLWWDVWCPFVTLEAWKWVPWTRTACGVTKCLMFYHAGYFFSAKNRNLMGLIGPCDTFGCEPVEFRCFKQTIWQLTHRMLSKCSQTVGGIASVFICGNNTLMTTCVRGLWRSRRPVFNEWRKKTLNNARHENENGKRNQPTFSQTMQLSISQTLEFLSSFLFLIVFLWAEKRLDKYRCYTCAGHELKPNSSANMTANLRVANAVKCKHPALVLHALQAPTHYIWS